MGRLQRDFANSTIAKRLCKEWILQDGKDPEDKAILQSYIDNCLKMSDDEITSELLIVYEVGYRSNAERQKAMEILLGCKIDYM